jgi:hypothetical protein
MTLPAGSVTGSELDVVVLGVVLIAACAAVLARLLAPQPRWTLTLRHCLAEAALRASSTWAELGDWLRLGR